MTTNNKEIIIGKVIDLRTETVVTESGKNIPLEYQLLEVECFKPTYLILLKGENETALEMIGTKKCEADMIFKSIVEGKVTPCTLKYVCNDISYEKIN